MNLQSAKSDGAPRRIRKDPNTVRQVLDKLDASSGGAGANARRSQRFQYRVDTVEIEFASGSGEWDRHVVVTRNLSREGLGCVVGQFIYPGSACVAMLRSAGFDYTQRVPGKVMRCRYLPGSGSLYEVGVRFDAPVDLAMFVQGAVDTRVLLATADDATQRGLSRLIASLSCTVSTAKSGTEAVEQAAGGNFDAVLLDLELPALDGSAAAAQLRERGYIRPIVALTAADDDATRAACLEKGFTACLCKPGSRAQLEPLLRSFHADPIFSSLARDANLAGMIAEFIEGLPEELRTMESAFARKDSAALRGAAAEVRSRAEANGFAPVAAAADELTATLTEAPDFAAVRGALDKLCRTCLSARRAAAGPARPARGV